MSESGPQKIGLSTGQSEERFRLLVESVQDYAIFILDPTGHITSWNAGAQRMKGYSAEEILGKHFSVFYEPEVAARGHPEYELAVAASEGRYEEEGWRLRKDGSRFWANVVITALRDNKGDLAGFAKVTRDMTERRMAEEELERRVEERTAALAESSRRVEALNEQLKRAMRETHHRVKNNLQVVCAMIDIQIQAHREVGAVPLDEMARLGNHIRTLAAVHDMLTQSMQREESDGLLPVEDVLTRLLPLLEQTVAPARIRYEIQDAVLPSKQCVALALILNELVSNASRHGGPEIDVAFRTRDGMAELLVLDNGPGFAPHFHPLTCSNLGLDLINSLATTDLRGEVRFENRPSGGAMVSARFPLPQ